MKKLTVAAELNRLNASCVANVTLQPSIYRSTNWHMAVTCLLNVMSVADVSTKRVPLRNTRKHTLRIE